FTPPEIKRHGRKCRDGSGMQMNVQARKGHEKTLRLEGQNELDGEAISPIQPRNGLFC
ncbi:MAG: hypothetical protein RL147_267, partial [Actinomycetota bacterium]